MGSIIVRNLCKQYGGQIILDNLSLDLHSGEVVGLVGRNGVGKTTLFRLLAGLSEPDSGTVVRSQGLDVGYLPQDPVIDLENTLRSEVAVAFADLLALEERLHELSARIAETAPAEGQEALIGEYARLQGRFEAAGGYALETRLNQVLSGLGFRADEHGLPLAALSGGQRCRAALARLLLQEDRFLLLDEPTNHLDIDAVRWLERFLGAHRGGAVIVAHDRYLLDRLTQRIVEMERGRVVSYPGNYTNFRLARELRRLTQERRFVQDRNFLAKEREFIARFQAGQRSKESKGRLKRLERRLADGEFVLEKPGEERRFALAFERPVGHHGTILETEDLSKTYGDKVLFRDLTVRVEAGERLGITGPNGVGKSTLLKIALGMVEADAGKVELRPRGTLGYYAQDVGHELNPALTVLDTLLTARPGLREQDARSLLGAFLFSGEEVFKRVENLSGGEQSRLRLIRLVFSSPAVLILDEPTNHLDIAAREALEEALGEFPGTLIMVSHDRYFLDRIIDKLLVMRPEGQRLVVGNYTTYLAQLEDGPLEPAGVSPGAAGAAAVRGERAGARGEGVGTRSERGGRRVPAEAPRSSRPTSPYDRLTVAELEEMIMVREEQIAALHARFADPQVVRNPGELAATQSRLEELRRELVGIEEAWSERGQEH